MHEDSGEGVSSRIALAPVGETERIISLDVLRGVAILGIFFVNIAFFAGPMEAMMLPAPLADQPWSERLAWMFVKVFAELKFISLFSLLFGIGLVVQLNRARQRGGELGATYLRRLAVLAVIGLAHGILIWYGDILFMYAVGGVVLFLFRNASAKSLAIVALLCFLLGGLIYSGMSALGVAGQAFERRMAETAATEPEPAAQPAAQEPQALSANVDDRRERWDAAYERWKKSGFNVLDESWGEMEMIAYKEGPMSVTIWTRSFAYAGHVIVAGILGGFGLRVLGMFLFGAALMKWNFFDSRFRALHLHMFLWGITFGVLLEASIAWLYHVANYQMTMTTWMADSMHYLSSLILMLGYVGGVCTLVHAGALRWLQSALAAVGRMALTNYLMQSLIATFIMYWWGLALFGEFSRAQQLSLVVGIFAFQVVFSLIWLHLFRFGPMEWLWRTLAYWKPQPMMRMK